MAEVRRRLLSNTTYLLIAWIGSIFLNFFFQLVATKTLLPEELGTLAATINFAALTSALLVFGMEHSTQRLAAYYIGKNKVEYLRSVLWFLLLVTIFLNAVSIGGLLLFSSKISDVLKLPQNILFIGISVVFPLSMAAFFAGVLRGYQNMKYLTITAVVGDFLKLIVSVFLVLLGYKIFGFLIGYLTFAISVFLLRISTVRMFISKIPKPNIKMIASYAIPAFITQLFWLLLLNGQYLIISAIQGTYQTGLFAVGMLLSNQIYFLPRIISDALFPITSQFSGNRTFIKQQRNLLNLALRYSLLVSLPFLFFIVSFPKPLIFLIGRPHFFPAADLVPILVSAALVFGIATLLSRTLYAIGRPVLFQNISIICAAFYLVSSITLTYFFSVLGTSVAFLLTAILLALISLPYLKRYIQFKIDFSSIFKILLSSFLTFVTLYLISFFVPNLIIGGILTALFTLLYFAILYFLKFYNINDIKILDFLSEKIPFLSRYTRLAKILILKRIQQDPEENK